MHGVLAINLAIPDTDGDFTLCDRTIFQRFHHNLRLYRKFRDLSRRASIWGIVAKSFIYTVTDFGYSVGMNIFDSIRLQRTALSVASLDDPSDEKSYWLSKTPYERLEAVEIMRQILYGYDPTTIRLQRVLEVTQLP
jgi:hypothetical protein